MPTFAATPAVDEAAIPDAAPVASWITPVVVDLNGDNTAATDSDRCACAALSDASLMKPALSKVCNTSWLMLPSAAALFLFIESILFTPHVGM
jgi:hypothetical protein